MDEKVRLRIKRHSRVRHKVIGTAGRPRLNVFRSLKNIYAQLIDDASGKTLASVSSRALGVKGSKVDQAKAVGEGIAKKAVSAKIEKAVFDRGSYRFHGRVKALADAARKAGLTI